MICAPRQKDFDAIAEITNHYIATDLLFGHTPVTATTMRAVHKMRDRHPWYVFEEEGTVLGYAMAGRWRDYRDQAYQWTCEVAVYVAEQAQGRGIDDQLYSALLTESAKYYRTAVATVAERPANSALHERCGFTRVGTIPDAAWKNNAWHTVEIWHKQLQTGSKGPP